MLLSEVCQSIGMLCIKIADLEMVVYAKVLRCFGGIVFGAMVGLDIFFLAFVSGAPMNPDVLFPRLGVCVVANLWLYR
ncbi:MAG TPA: hypothetical protein VE573_05490 [Nitrososphaeraceae archaeon]|nr:hypothetical protein [Nitrososphaeraceae archaeon]